MSYWKVSKLDCLLISQTHAAARRRNPHQALFSSTRARAPLEGNHSAKRYCSCRCDAHISNSPGCCIRGVVSFRCAYDLRGSPTWMNSCEGGIAPSLAVTYLSALNELVNSSPLFSRLPRLSFSYGMALQAEALKHWVIGDGERAKEAFQKWSKACFRAGRGDEIYYKL